ncbi:MAG: hypothetical protein EPO41_03890 [Reyranella sp.]|uniref:hypothetical protein n=1 Tax=Reyranella sp. TaxID=1929291 RepID=UPI0011F8273F|nr:hypothetical protein [Reyranella sp.]TAJ97143.1 MAG: hypothetical protein EPO41_03890 [Reyranella sp.]
MSAPYEPEFVLPRTADEVIELLERAFPLRNIPSETPYHVMQREFGRRDVIDFLRRLKADRDEDILKG